MKAQPMKFSVGDQVRIPGGGTGIVSRRERRLNGEYPIPGKYYPEVYRVECRHGGCKHFSAEELEAAQ